MATATLHDAGEELAGLLDTLTARAVRLGLSADRKRLTLDAPAGAITPELREALRAHRGELLAALTTTPAPARAGLHICAWGAPHFPHWRYSIRERRLVCLSCYPELARECPRIERPGAQEEAQGEEGEEAQALDTSEEARQEERRRKWIAGARRELAAWGEAHAWPRQAIAYAVTTHAGNAQAYKCIAAGASSWALFLAGASGPDMAAAYRAIRPAGLAQSSAGEEGEEARAGEALAQEAHREEAPGSPAPAPDASARRSRPRGARADRRGEALAVLDCAGLWIERQEGEEGATGEALACRTDGVPAPSSSLHAGELLALAQRHGVTQLWVHASWALAAGLPDRLRGVKPSEGAPHAFVGEAIAAGWDIRPAGLAPWLHCLRRGTYGAVALVFPHLETRAPWREARDGRELLGALLAYREALAGYGYRRSPGATGTGLLRSVHSGNRVALDLSASAAPQDFPAPARAGHAAPDLIWARPLSSEERERCAYVHAYDKNAMYLGASSSLPLGLGIPEHCAGEGLTFDKRLAGYWRARIAYTAPAGLPDPFTAPMHATDADGYGWYMTPAIELAYQVGAAIELQEAYVWRSSHRLFAPWYERMRDARAGLLDRASAPGAGDPAAALALGAVKRTYTQTFGWLNGGWLRRSEAPEDLYRPDWRDSVMAQAAANLYRELLKVQRETGCVPFALDTDAAYYASASADAASDVPAPLTLGTGLRHVKVKTNGAPLAPVVPLLDRLCASGASANRIIDELQDTLAGASVRQEA